jgi:hypothetical protein
MKRNQQLANILASKTPNKNLVAANKIPTPDTKNLSGHAAYTQDKWFTLLSMLNTLKVEPQFYRSESEIVNKLISIVDACAKEDKYLTAQCIVYSRCGGGEGMRTVNQIAAVALAKHLSGEDWAKRFFNRWDKKKQEGGIIFRADDMSDILLYWEAMNRTLDNKRAPLSASLKKGFRDALERMDTHSLLKYKVPLMDVINLVHPRAEMSKAVVTIQDRTVSTFEAIMKGYSVSADTWEVAQSDAGQQVAQAVREGKVSVEDAKDILESAKSENWKQLLEEGKLGILAALRNIRSILLNKPDRGAINALCVLLSSGKEIIKGKIMPSQLDMANEVLLAEFNDANARDISMALSHGYLAALPNLKDALPGNNLVILDCSGSMTTPIRDPQRKVTYRTSCQNKAALIAATIAKATNADIIQFGSTARYKTYNPNADLFQLGVDLRADMGCTNLATAWQLAKDSGRAYTRVFILSDNECNRGNTYDQFKQYTQKMGSPYVYSVDLAAYGSNCIAGENVRFYYGYGYGMFTDIASSEFNPSYHMDKVKQIKI